MGWLKEMGAKNPVIEAIRTRRSVRQFTSEPVSDDAVNEILGSAVWAPSGKNNQPWKFAVIQDPGLKELLAALTHS